MPRAINVPLSWDPAIIAILSEVAPDDVEGAKVWWEMYAPVLYTAILDSLAVGDSSVLREDVYDAQWVADYMEKESLTPAQRAWRTAGLLFLFVGGRYYTMRGTGISGGRVFGSLNRALSSSSTDTMALCGQLRDGSIGLRSWQMQMKNNIMHSQVSAAILASGGQFTDSILRDVTGRIQFQLQHLDRFALAIAAGMKLDGTVCRLMKMYINSARGTYHSIDGIMKAGLGFNEYKNVLGPSEAHCDTGTSCISVSDAGWQLVGSLPPIGSRTCLSNCLCHWEYRNSITGIEW